jgi:hypothetical protein
LDLRSSPFDPEDTGGKHDVSERFGDVALHNCGVRGRIISLRFENHMEEKGVSFNREQLEAWAFRSLTDREVER